jgi:type VI secretion system VasD/TssJ family lipoprotein
MGKNLNRMLVLSCFFFISFITSCASTPAYRYEVDAIKLDLKSAKDLNLYEGQSHTLLLCVYQLKDPNAFKQLSEENEGLSKLLGCSSFDASVTGSKRLVIQPNEATTRMLDRAEGTKYVGIVAGYYKMQKENMSHLENVPLSIFTKNPKKMEIRLFLGAQEIQEVREK